jgi:probable rRNA maturation factor
MSLLIRNFTKCRIPAKRLEAVMAAVLAEEKMKKEAEVSLVFTGEKRIKDLNKRYRGIDRVTDVLSFEGENDDGFVDPKDDISYLGEVFICCSRAKKQAAEHAHPLGNEIDILLVHGLFHLLGYDHIQDSDYEVMRRKEERVLRRLFG